METLLFELVSTLLIYMLTVFGVSLYIHNNSIADVAYGGGFVLVAWLSYMLGNENSIGFLLVLLVSVWGVRLIYRIARKNYGKPEDFRYKAWREEWGTSFWWRSLLQIYVLQGTVIAIIASSRSRARG